MTKQETKKAVENYILQRVLIHKAIQELKNEIDEATYDKTKTAPIDPSEVEFVKKQLTLLENSLYQQQPVEKHSPEYEMLDDPVAVTAVGLGILN